MAKDVGHRFEGHARSNHQGGSGAPEDKGATQVWRQAGSRSRSADNRRNCRGCQRPTDGNPVTDEDVASGGRGPSPTQVGTAIQKAIPAIILRRGIVRLRSYARDRKHSREKRSVAR